VVILAEEVVVVVVEVVEAFEAEVAAAEVEVEEEVVDLIENLKVHLNLSLVKNIYYFFFV
jgi:hypothetical protein